MSSELCTITLVFPKCNHSSKYKNTTLASTRRDKYHWATWLVTDWTKTCRFHVISRHQRHSFDIWQLPSPATTFVQSVVTCTVSLVPALSGRSWILFIYLFFYDLPCRCISCLFCMRLKFGPFFGVRSSGWLETVNCLSFGMMSTLPVGRHSTFKGHSWCHSSCMYWGTRKV